jgi:hypothetical protein
MTEPASAAPQFVLSAHGINARAELRGDAFVVLAGSSARLGEVPHFSRDKYAVLRQEFWILDSWLLI